MLANANAKWAVTAYEAVYNENWIHWEESVCCVTAAKSRGHCVCQGVNSLFQKCVTMVTVNNKDGVSILPLKIQKILQLKYQKKKINF